MRRYAPLVGALLLVGCVDDGQATVQPYDRAPVPAVPDRTAPIDPATIAGDGSLTNVADGDYWADAVAVGSGVPFIMFDLSQALFAQTCIDELGEQNCVDGYGVIAEPHGTLTVLYDDLRSVTVVAESQQNFAIPGAELASLVGGNFPSSDPPGDYRYVSYPFVVTVRDGQIVDAHQIWLPGFN
jgi:hypothetical protein